MVTIRKPYDIVPAVLPVRFPRETQGPCRTCRKWDTLGGGLCQRCWDGRQMPSYKSLGDVSLDTL